MCAIEPESIGSLVHVARRAKDSSWAHFSEPAGGAAVLTEEGNVFPGCRTDSPISGLGVCAERNAVNHAIIHGETTCRALAVVSNTGEPLLPCGGCLQYLQELARLASHDITIVAEGESGRRGRVVTSVDELLRGGFPPQKPFHELERLFRWSDRTLNALKTSGPAYRDSSVGKETEAVSKYENLLAAAAKAVQRARVPVSRFPVGAALLTETESIYIGCNTESLITGLGICAERNAANHAVVHGETRFRAVAVVSERDQPLLPCGVCLQYLSEFARWHRGDMDIICRGRSGRVIFTTLRQCLIV